MKILIAPDKFKGSLSANDVCNAVEEGVQNVFPNSIITKIPLADGGEESLEALETIIKFDRKYLTVSNPLFDPIDAWYGYKDDTAYIEMAKVSGLQLLKEEERNPNLTSSLGTGELIVDAINNGAKKIILFVGGSATNDAGIGIASALGYVFNDASGKALKPIGESLAKISSVDSKKAMILDNTEFMVLTDVKNLLFGRNGAAQVFAKQKGANEEVIISLDNGLRNFANVVNTKLNIDVANLSGAGAAGGVGAGMVAFCNAKIKSGIEEILNLTNIDNQIEKCDFVITGEGKFDSQTLEGKVVKGIADRCKKTNKPLGIVCGDVSLIESELTKINATIIKSIKTKNISHEDSMHNAYPLLVKRTEELVIEYNNTLSD